MSEDQPNLLLVSSDLMLGGLANTQATNAGFRVLRCLSEVKAHERLAEQSFEVVVVELGISDLDLERLKKACGEAAVVGFAGHVRTDLLTAADRAGLTVLTNGQLHGQGAEILAKIRQKQQTG